jgi:hypothetical protein
MPWMAREAAGIGSPGSISRLKAPSSSSFPRAIRTPPTSITRAVATSSPVVSVSMTASDSDPSCVPDETSACLPYGAMKHAPSLLSVSGILKRMAG